MDSYKTLAAYIKSTSPDLANEDDREVARYAVESFPDQFKESEFDWEKEPGFFDKVKGFLTKESPPDATEQERYAQAPAISEEPYQGYKEPVEPEVPAMTRSVQYGKPQETQSSIPEAPITQLGEVQQRAMSPEEISATLGKIRTTAEPDVTQVRAPVGGEPSVAPEKERYAEAPVLGAEPYEGYQPDVGAPGKEVPSTTTPEIPISQAMERQQELRSPGEPAPTALERETFRPLTEEENKELQEEFFKRQKVGGQKPWQEFVEKQAISAPLYFMFGPKVTSQVLMKLHLPIAKHYMKVTGKKAVEVAPGIISQAIANAAGITAATALPTAAEVGAEIAPDISKAKTDAEKGRLIAKAMKRYGESLVINALVAAGIGYAAQKMKPKTIVYAKPEPEMLGKPGAPAQKAIGGPAKSAGALPTPRGMKQGPGFTMAEEAAVAPTPMKRVFDPATGREIAVEAPPPVEAPVEAPTVETPPVERRRSPVVFENMTEEQSNAILDKLPEPERNQLIESQRALETKTYTDQLTGTLNRQGAQKRGYIIVENGEEGFAPGPVMMFDIDKFKPINDTFGHSVGDEVLRAYGALLKKHLDPFGDVVRFGGEEFALVGFDKSQVEPILKAVDAARAELGKQTFAGGKLENVNFSAGVSDESATAADKELYAAKEGGRGQTFYKGQRFSPVQQDVEQTQPVPVSQPTKEVDPTTKEPWQVPKSELVPYSKTVPKSKAKLETQGGWSEQEINARALANRLAETEPSEYEPYPIGAWGEDATGELMQLRVYDIDDPNLVYPESLPKNVTVDKYVEWIKEGSTPPPARAIETAEGKIKILDGHHRIAALKQSGHKKFATWVSITEGTRGVTHEQAVEKAIKEGKISAEPTKEVAPKAPQKKPPVKKPETPKKPAIEQKAVETLPTIPEGVKTYGRDKAAGPTVKRIVPKGFKQSVKPVWSKEYQAWVAPNKRTGVSQTDQAKHDLLKRGEIKHDGDVVAGPDEAGVKMVPVEDLPKTWTVNGEKFEKIPRKVNEGKENERTVYTIKDGITVKDVEEGEKLAIDNELSDTPLAGEARTTKQDVVDHAQREKAIKEKKQAEADKGLSGTALDPEMRAAEEAKIDLFDKKTVEAVKNAAPEDKKEAVQGVLASKLPKAPTIAQNKVDRDAVYGSPAPDPIADTEGELEITQYPKSLTDNLSGKNKPKGAQEVMDKIAKIAEVPIRVGRIKQKALGIYKTRPEVIRIRTALDIYTSAHEAGHAISKEFFADGKMTPKERKELIRLGKNLYGNRQPKGGYASEGFAEFFAQYISGGSGPSVSPVFNKRFTAFLEANQDFAARLNAARDAALKYGDQGALKRVSSHIEFGRANNKFKQIVKQVFSKKAWLDEFDPLYNIQKAAETKKGVRLKPSEAPFTTASALKYTHEARVRYMAEEAMIDLAGNPIGPPLAEATAIVKGRRKEFTTYLYARRALERWGKGKNPGISKEDAKYVFEQLDSREFRLAAKKVYEWNKGILNYLVQADPSMAEPVMKILDGSTNYVPLARVFDEVDTQAFQMYAQSKGASNPLSRMVGSGRRIRDPFQVMIENAGRLLKGAHQRVVLRQVVKLQNVPGMGKYIERIPPDMVPTKINVEELNKKLKKMGVELDEDEVGDLITLFHPATQYKGKDPIMPFFEKIPVFDEGGTPVLDSKGRPTFENKMVWFQLDQELYDALNGMDVYRLPKVFDLMFGMPSRAFKLGTTGLRATFSLVRNPLRDLPTFLLQTHSNTHTLGAISAWIKQMAAAGKSAVPGVGRNPYHELFVRLGAEMSQPLGQDTMQSRRAVKDLFKGKVVRIVTSPVAHLRDVLQVPETATRTAETRLLCEQLGINPNEPITLDQSLQLLLASKRVTTDFGAAGWLAKIINQIVPFFNPNIQGVRTMGRTIKRKPLKASLSAIGLLTLPTLALWWKNKDKKWYKDMPWREKFGYWNIEGGDEVVRIPRPFDWGNVYSVIPEAILDAEYQKNPEEIKKLLEHLFETSVPDLMPRTFLPIKEQLQNKVDFTGIPIVKHSELYKPYEEQYGRYTSELAKFVGKTFKWSPERIDHLISGYFGGLGRDVVGYVGLGPKLAKKRFTMSDTPLIGTLFRRGGVHGRSQALNDVYDKYSEYRREFFSSDLERANDPKTLEIYYTLDASIQCLKIYNDLMKTEEGKEAKDKIAYQIRELATGTIDTVKKMEKKRGSK